MLDRLVGGIVCVALNLHPRDANTLFVGTKIECFLAIRREVLFHIYTISQRGMAKTAPPRELSGPYSPNLGGNKPL